MKTSNRILGIAGCLALAVLFALPMAAKTNTLQMEIGDPERKASQVELVLDAITDTATGELIGPAEMAAKLAGKRIVFVGESHTSFDSHQVEMAVIRALHEAGRNVLIGLEMFPYTHQGHLDSWVGGHYSEDGFLELADWYNSWGYPWNYYREIFFYARDNGLPMYALNTPREVISAVRKKGFDELTDEEKTHMPPQVDVENEDHYKLFGSFFEPDEDDEEGGMHSQMPEEALRSMFDAQCTWDATFGHKALKALETQGDPEAVLVVLVGSGHVTYDLGIQRQIANWEEVPMATVIGIPVKDYDGERVDLVQASYADFLWGLPRDTDPIYPTLGFSSRGGGEDGLRSVIYIGKDSVAENAGFQVGDMLVSMDGEPIADRGSIMRLMAEKNWGDSAVVRVQRGEIIVDLDVQFRRTVEDEDEEEESEVEAK